MCNLTCHFPLLVLKIEYNILPVEIGAQSIQGGSQGLLASQEIPSMLEAHNISGHRIPSLYKLRCAWSCCEGNAIGSDERVWVKRGEGKGGNELQFTFPHMSSWRRHYLRFRVPKFLRNILTSACYIRVVCLCTLCLRYPADLPGL